MDTYNSINLLDKLQRKIFILLLFIQTFDLHKENLHTRFLSTVKALTFRPLQLVPIRVAA